MGPHPQNTVLFSDSIKANIAYGMERPVSDEEVIEACERAHVHLPASPGRPRGGPWAPTGRACDQSTTHEDLRGMHSRSDLSN